MSAREFKNVLFGANAIDQRNAINENLSRLRKQPETEDSKAIIAALLEMKAEVSGGVFEEAFFCKKKENAEYALIDDGSKEGHEEWKRRMSELVDARIEHLGRVMDEARRRAGSKA